MEDENIFQGYVRLKILGFFLVFFLLICLLCIQAVKDRAGRSEYYRGLQTSVETEII